MIQVPFFELLRTISPDSRSYRKFLTESVSKLMVRLTAEASLQLLMNSNSGITKCGEEQKGPGTQGAPGEWRKTALPPFYD